MSLVLVGPALALAPAAAGLSLVESNPFIWPGFQPPQEARPAPPPAQTADDLEFHAVYELDGITRVLLRDRRTQQFQWIILGEEAEGLIGKTYDPDNNQLLVAHGGTEKTLALRPLPQASGPAVVTAPTPVPSATATSAARRTVIRPSVPTPTGTSSVRTTTPPTIRRPVTTSGSSPARAITPQLGRSVPRAPGVQEPAFRPQDPGLTRPITDPPRDIPVLDPTLRGGNGR